MVLLAAFKTLLYRYTAQEDILVGTFIANRDRVEIEPLMGRFMSMLPVRTDLGGNPRFRELLRTVREAALGAYFHRYLPFESLPEEMSRPDASETRPLFNVAFGAQNTRGRDLRMGDVVIEPLVGQEETARFDLTLRVKESLEGMQVDWVYRNDLFAEKTVIRMHHHFETLLLNIVDRPEARLTTLKLTSRSDNRPAHMERGSQEESDRAKLMSMKRKGVNLSTEPV
jgi:non-ribosomal peptide synthetase component F